MRWGLVLLLAWIAAMKFTTYEATGIAACLPQPAGGWMYDRILDHAGLHGNRNCGANRTVAVIAQSVRHRQSSGFYEQIVNAHEYTTTHC